MGLYRKFVSQTRKPEGVLGKVMVNGMNGGHAKLADWGMSHLPDITPKQIAELGCGGGRNAAELVRKFPAATVTAVDYSDVSVAKSTEYNKEFIDAGLMTVRQGDVSNLDLPEGSYDLATAFETIYFWPGLEKCFAEVAKILKPNGTFMIVNESDGEDETSLKFEKIIDGMKCYTPEVIKDALISAGFTDVRTEHHESKAWITVIARKSSLR
ncbi:MAG: class I SAM-dependent methyltransferase [Saccharofermentans sp.]|nr:class I SAM-dependent methyltransferase [Saccharofermentans sp.]